MIITKSPIATIVLDHYQQPDTHGESVHSRNSVELGSGSCHCSGSTTLVFDAIANSVPKMRRCSDCDNADSTSTTSRIGDKEQVDVHNVYSKLPASYAVACPAVSTITPIPIPQPQNTHKHRRRRKGYYKVVKAVTLIEVDNDSTCRLKQVAKEQKQSQLLLQYKQQAKDENYRWTAKRFQNLLEETRL